MPCGKEALYRKARYGLCWNYRVLSKEQGCILRNLSELSYYYMILCEKSGNHTIKYPYNW